MRVHLLALDGLFDTGLATLLDVFTTVNDLAEATGKRSARFEVTVVGMRSRVKTGQGLTVPVVPAGRLPRPDVAVVVALGAKRPPDVRAALSRSDVEDAGHAIAGWSRGGTLLGAACTGTFVLARTGLLDGGRATTTWWLAPLFRELHPRVTLEEAQMVVGSSRFVTAGAALAHLDLALWLVRRTSPSLATLAARYLLVDDRASQAAYAIPDQTAHEDELVARFERWARKRLALGFSLEEAASAAGTSPRTLARRLDAVLGKSPLSYFQDLRVERAVHLLRSKDTSLEKIAGEVGYADAATLRALIRRKLGRGVRELRN